MLHAASAVAGGSTGPDRRGDTDPASATVYGISEVTTTSPSRAYLLEIDSATEKIKRVVSAGSSATDLALHQAEGRIYVTNWLDGKLLAFNRDSLVIERSYIFPPFQWYWLFLA